MANRFDLKEFRGRKVDDELKKEMEEKIRNFLFDEGCYGATGLANVLVELIWGVIPKYNEGDK